MSKNDPERARRLAEALRANLKKRKAPKERPAADGTAGKDCPQPSDRQA
ncbi:MAG: hypothetical protein ACKOXK_05745 [Chakrabartia sp.]